jgi:transposase
MKQDVAEDIVKRIDFAKKRTGLSYRDLCRAMDVSHRTFKRWRRRKESGQPLLHAPGPSKTGAFDPAVLAGELVFLTHGAHRTLGIGRLYGKYGQCLSRREIACMAAELRAELNDIHRRNLLRVEWLAPGVAWAIDGTEYSDASGKRQMMTTRDLCSKYLFRPMVTAWTPCSEEVGGNMALLCNGNEAPLLLKMDNGGNLIGQGTMKVLVQNRIIPLISPPEYPQYNGSLEKVQGDIKDAIRRSLPLSREVSPEEFELHAALAAHDLNHRSKDILRGKNPCQVYHDETRRIRFTVPERKVIYDWISQTQDSILKEVQDFSKKSVATARRKAIEAWLLKNNIIRLTLNGKSVTQFSG